MNTYECTTAAKRAFYRAGDKRESENGRGGVRHNRNKQDITRSNSRKERERINYVINETNGADINYNATVPLLCNCVIIHVIP